jgi:hypothetical protein
MWLLSVATFNVLSIKSGCHLTGFLAKLGVAFTHPPLTSLGELKAESVKV